MKRQLDEPSSDGRDIKRCKLASSGVLQAFESSALAQGVKVDQLQRNRPLIYLPLILEHFFSCIDSQSEVHVAFHMRIAVANIPVGIPTSQDGLENVSVAL